MGAELRFFRMMKKVIAIVVLLLTAVYSNAKNDNILRSLVFKPGCYYQGIEAASPIIIYATDGIVTEDKDFVVNYSVIPSNLDQSVIDSYKYSLSTIVQQFSTRASASSNYVSCPIKVKSHGYSEGVLSLTCTIKKGSKVSLLDNEIYLFRVQAERNDSTVTSDDGGALLIDCRVGGKDNVVKNPTISYVDGNLVFNCETKDAIVKSEIKCPDVNTYSGNEISLERVYNITAYAQKAGCYDSEKVTAKLYWLDGTIETTEVNNMNAKARGVLVQQNDGVLTISGLNDGEQVSLYSVDGTLLGKAKAIGGTASYTVANNQIVIAKIGSASIKVAIR